MFTRVGDNLQRWEARMLGHGGINYDHAEMRRRRPNLFVLTDKHELVDPVLSAACDGVLDSASIERMDERKISQSGFYVYFSRAELSLPGLARIVKCGGVFAPPPFFWKVPFHLVSAKALDTYNEAGVRLDRDPYMGLEVSSQLCQAAELTKDVPGDFIEIGVYSGSTALSALIHMRNIGVRRRCWLLDTYSGFTYQTAKDSPDVIWTGTHSLEFDKTIERIKNLTADIGQEVHVKPTEICADELPPEIEKIAFANIDVDLYEAIDASLRKVGERMSVRGIMVLEDPTSTPALYGAYLAMEQFLETGLGRKFIRVRTTEQYFLIRVEA